MPSPSPPPRTALDDRVEKLTGYTGQQLRRHDADGLLSADLAALAKAHQDLVAEEADVAYHLGRLHQLSAGRSPADAALLERLERVVRHLAEAVTRRDARLAAASVVLEPLEQAARDRETGVVPELPAPDFAHLLALARGAKLHQNLVTQRLSVVTASGARLPYPALQRLEKAGLVEIDRSHPLHAGQPVTLTGLGRRTLTGRSPAPAGPQPPGAAVPAAYRR
ncbi:hypothetical protein [Streptomyces sp. HPF1205]|uniref:hypothetical protein n=1 Tax=Streptomyces sp. HPF1205 TaxID=2873262 RepID=UPI001CEDE9B5|nr:hypothetical protein [Streptomyces sp. HPF1205]